MIRVLHVLGGLNRGGAETMVMNFYRYIDKSEVQFDFIIHSDSQNDYREEIESMGGKIYVFPKFKVYNILSYRNTWKSFFDAHPEYRRLSSPKNHIFLLKVFKGILEKNSKSILLIIGDGELKEEINTKIKDLNLKGKVFMMGSREDVDNILQAVDVFLFPSFWEGLPVAVVEAEASGLPCILSESVTEEVKLLPNLKYLPINQGEGIWVNYILNMKKNRLKEASEIVRSKGFDIRDTTRWLLEFYNNLAS